MNRKAIVIGRGVQLLGNRPGVVKSIGDRIWVETFGGDVLEARPQELIPLEQDDQIRFSWGFHDGAAHVREGSTRARELANLAAHMDQAWAVGYARGVAFARANLPTESSLAAWNQLARYRALLPVARRELFEAVLAADANRLPGLAAPARSTIINTPTGSAIVGLLVLVVSLLVPSLAHAGTNDDTLRAIAVLLTKAPASVTFIDPAVHVEAGAARKKIEKLDAFASNDGRVFINVAGELWKRATASEFYRYAFAAVLEHEVSHLEDLAAGRPHDERTACAREAALWSSFVQTGKVDAEVGRLYASLLKARKH